MLGVRREIDAFQIETVFWFDARLVFAAFTSRHQSYLHPKRLIKHPQFQFRILVGLDTGNNIPFPGQSSKHCLSRMKETISQCTDFASGYDWADVREKGEPGLLSTRPTRPCSSPYYALLDILPD
jgi:hypothetical protein